MDWVEAEDDARLSHVMGLETDGRRGLPFAFGLVGGEVGMGEVTGMGLEMDEMEGLARWWEGRLSIVEGERAART